MLDKKIISFDGLGLLLLTSFGYTATYVYEIGSCSYYNIPIELIDLDLAKFITTGFVCSYFLFFVMIFLNYLLLMVERKRKNYIFHYIFYNYLPFFIIGIIIFVYTDFLLNSFMALLFFPVFLLLTDLIPPMLIFNSKKYEFKFKFWTRFKRYSFSNGFSRENNKYFNIAFNYLSISIYCLIVIYFIGYAVSAQKTKYPLANDMIILKIYGGNAISIKHSENNSISGSLKYIKFENAVVSNKEIGKLLNQ